MAKIKKKNTTGAARNYITRTQAVRKLQISLADFRRLCIFKGIYPREPKNKKKANKGSTAPTTFYYIKDIQYIAHEPVLEKFREHKTFAKKLSRALGRGDVNGAKRLDTNRPRYKLDHIVKERYPSFLDALRDLDDPLCMLFLFAAMPATDKISQRVTEDADRLCNQWMAYVAREGLLKKVFVSIKGVYYQAVVKGQEITWLVPFKFPQNIPSDIDFRIMLTFLEFYTTLLSFVLYRLYTEAGLVYPPTINKEKINGVGGISAYVLKSRESSGNTLLPSAEAKHKINGNKMKKVDIDQVLKVDAEADQKNGSLDTKIDEEDNNEEDNNEELDQFEALPETDTANRDILAQPKSLSASSGQLFSNFVFYIGREVPLDILEFLILAFGGKFISESSLDDLQEAAKDIDLSKVTHQISDRPALSSVVAGRTYIQPQWVFDSINKDKLLPVADYAIGETLPPHLSPWGDAAGYDPEAPLEEQEESEEEEAEIEEETDEEEDEIEEEDLEAFEAQKELEREVSGKKFSEEQKDKPTKKPKKRSTAEITAEEEKDLKKMMMTNKHKKLYNRMQHGLEKKQAREDELRKKRRKIENTKNKLSKR